MARRFGKSTVTVSGGLCIAVALMLLVLPLRWLLACLLAATFHELCHWVAIRLCHGYVVGLRVGEGGATMETLPMDRGKEVICALAGPLGGLLLLLFARYIPRTAICALVQSAYNLLPLFPLDGGRALRGVLSILLPPKHAQRACAIVESVVRGVLLAMGLCGTFLWHLGFLPLFTSTVMLYRTKNGKIPCKLSPQRVQ